MSTMSWVQAISLHVLTPFPFPCLLSAAAATTSESKMDFSSLPASALDNYIAYYDLAKGYPPPPSRRSPSPEEAAEQGDEDAEGRGQRESSKNIEDGKTVTTATRLRPRSPTASVAHLFPAGARRPGAVAGAANDGASVNGAEDADTPSHFFDAQEADAHLASVAERHFAGQPQPKEGEVVVQFLYRCRAGGEYF